MITKEQIIGTVNSLDDVFTIDDVFEKLLLLEKIETGIQQSKNGFVISDDELDDRMKQWFV